MITEKELFKMEAASHFLGDPGGEVVRKLIKEIRRLQDKVRRTRRHGMHGEPYDE